MPSSLTPNMNLVVPVVGQEPGPTWATDLNADLGILDQHNHSNGQGVQITPAGININADLPINGNNLTQINTARYNNLVSSLAGTSPNLSATYVAQNELYFNDSVGNVVKLTNSGAVNATSSGISSGTATASFSGSVLVVDSNVNTPADIQAGSILIGNLVANSNFVTLQAPSALAASYAVTLPPTNGTGGTVFLTYDSSNNQGVGPATTNGITRSYLAPVGQQVSSSCGNAALVSAGSFTPVTNLSITLTTSGRPVYLALQPDGTGNACFIFCSASNPASSGVIGVFRDSTQLTGGLAFQSNSINYPMPGFLYLDAPVAGTYTYTVQAAMQSAGGIEFSYAVLVAYEL